jgi:hypothetical protein
MICSRCGDLIVEDRFLDWNARWRCLKCGHLQDAVSIQSFVTRHEQTFVPQSAEPDYLDEEVHLSAESIIRPEVTVQYVRKRRSVQGA